MKDYLVSYRSSHSHRYFTGGGGMRFKCNRCFREMGVQEELEYLNKCDTINASQHRENVREFRGYNDEINSY